MRYFQFLLLVFLATTLSAQNFTKADSIRGGLTPERSWWDLNYYDLSVDVQVEQRSLSGTNEIRFTALQPGQRMQIDLQEPMRITKATFGLEDVAVKRVGNAHYIQLPYALKTGEKASVTIAFEGSPRVAKNAPWDGGFVWTTDANDKAWVANANQGIGASVWWPVKDHPADEVDSMRIKVICPNNLMDVSNGKLIQIEPVPPNKMAYTWEVKNPINDYGVNISIGDYAFWEETYEGEAGPLSMSYYVLRENKTKALSHFKDARLMMEAFEHWFGPYPFYEDGFKLVEVPYLGMEHQSAVTYGNKYQMGYLGSDLSGTGEGLKFDFIIVHESGHEWFANNLTNADVADMWIHEGFTAYSESLFLDYHYGKESASKYVIGTRRIIRNDRPIQSPYRGVAHEGSGDMYYKGSNLLHTLRMVINDDDKWRGILRGLNRDFRHQNISSQELIDYVAERTRTKNFAPLPFFATYVQSVDIPVFSYSLKKGKLNYQWKNVPKDFKMPVDIRFGEEQIRLNATTELQSEKLGKKVASIEVREDFYVNVEALK